jgi:hypothetical protein
VQHRERTIAAAGIVHAPEPGVPCTRYFGSLYILNWR